MSAISIENVKYVQHTFDWDAPIVAQTVSVVPASKPPRVSQACQESAVRRGRCEHVGSVMATVLNKYGLGIDDLLRAIEERQAQVGVSR
jgi:hypothetical protein